MKWVKKLTSDLMEIGLIRRLVKLHFFQFLLIAPATLFFILAAITIIFGVKSPAFNFGMVFTWVVWWGIVIFLIVIVGRGWCVMCPFGAFGEWVHRLSLWWKRKWGLGFNFKYPRRLQNLWLAIAIFITFIFLDNGYGLSNSPILTVGLITVLVLGAIWIFLLFERRTFCLYHCPLTVLIGMSSMLAPFEIRRKDAEVCRQCTTKACINGSEDAYGCPMMLRHCDFTIDERGHPLCQATCPAGVNSDGYVALIAQGKFKEALEVHRQTMPFAGVCGRICTHPCETACERGKADGRVSIQHLKRFMADYELRVGREKATPIKKTREDKVAIIGSGPAGLACAYDLVRQGYPVTVFEAASQAGGLLRYGIPEHRLPKRVLDDEISYIEELGVEIETNTQVKDLGDIFNQGYKAVFLGVGAGTSQKMGIPGEDTTGVIHALDFLKQVNSGVKVDLGERVAVIGGGNAAIDAARVAQRLGVKLENEWQLPDAARMAQRLGVKEVSIVYRRSQAEMPAIRSEVEEAEREGVKIHFLAAPVEVLTNDDRVIGIRCIRMELGEPDASGRRRPIPIEGSEFDMDVDNVIISIGQAVDNTALPKELGYTDWGTLVVNPVSRQTNIEGVFAGGDVVAGPANVIEVIADGKEAAISIGRYLNGVDLKEGRPTPIKQAEEVSKGGVEIKEMSVMPVLELEKRGTFTEVELGFDENTAIEEAKRCWNCAFSPSHDAIDRKRNCTECIKACPHDNIKMRFRLWGHDLWARMRGRLDESVASVVIAGLVTVVSLFLVLFLPPLKSFMETILPAGAPPSDWPRVVSIGLLFLSGIAVALLLMYGFSHLSRLFSGAKNIGTKTFFIHFGYAAIPLGIMKFIADILDHVFRTWGAIFDVTRALFLDFPFNRVLPEEAVTVKQLMTAEQTYVLQLVLISIGFGFSLYVAYKLAGRLFPDRDIAFRAFLPIGAFIFILGMTALWALSAAL